METVVVTRPMQWAAIPDISETEPLTQNDKDCLREVRDVLSRRGLLDKFGVSLIHKHFDIAPDEILVETIDVGNRTLTIQPVRREVSLDTIETQWQLADGEAVMYCHGYCNVGGGHRRYHEQKW